MFEYHYETQTGEGVVLFMDDVTLIDYFTGESSEELPDGPWEDAPWGIRKDAIYRNHMLPWRPWRVAREGEEPTRLFPSDVGRAMYNPPPRAGLCRVKTRTDDGLQTRLVRGRVPVEQLQFAWITQATDPVGEWPTRDRVLTARALLYDGLLIPGFAPGYAESHVQHPDEVLDLDQVPAWELVELIDDYSAVYQHDGRRILVHQDFSGSATGVDELTPTPS